MNPKPLNKFILRQHHLIPTSEDILANLNGNSIFRVHEINNGFWEYELNDSSLLFYTFSRPFGRYKFNPLPFGVSCAAEIFQKKSVYQGFVIHIANKTEVEHVKRLRLVLERAEQFNVKFKFNQLQYKLHEVNFLGQLISEKDIRPNQKNVEAVLAIESMKNKKELLRIFFPKMIC